MSVAPELCFRRRSSFFCILTIASDELVDGGGGGGTDEDDENVDEDEDEEDEAEEEEEAEEASLAGAPCPGARAPPTAPITGGAVTGASETLALDATHAVEEELVRPAVRSAAIATSRAAQMSSVRCLLRESTRA